MKTWIGLLVPLMLMGATTVPAEELQGRWRIGVGANYWVALKDLDEHDVDEDGFSYLASVQLRNPMAGIGVDVEMLPDRVGEDAYAGQAYVILGKAVYAGAGIGITLTDGEFADEPFFSFRAGLDLEIFPGLYLDIYGQYRFKDRADLKNEDTDIDLDTIFLGGALRLSF
jgi:hypothetical protein